MEQELNLPYYQRTRGKSLSEFMDDADFQQDLVDFFQSSRYNYSADKIKSMKPADLADEFYKHMRYQSVNEATALRDLQFVTQDDLNDPDIKRGKDAFGRLMLAWDESDGEELGAGVVGDYFMGSLVSPSTVASVLTAGVGSVPAKVSAQAAKVGANIAMREAVKAGLRRQTVGQAIAIGAARGAAVEGVLGGAMEYTNQRTRDEAVEDYDIDAAEIAIAGGASALFGGILGGAARGTLQARNNNKGAQLIEQVYTETMRRQMAAQNTVSAAIGASKDTDALEASLDNVVDYAAMLAEATTGKRYDPRDPLNKDMVALGDRVKKAILEGYTEDDLPMFMELGIAPDQLQKVAAASVELVNRLGITPEDLKTTRITQLIADRDDGATVLREVKDRLGLTSDEISAVFVAEFSRAGKTLQFASEMAKAVKGTPTERKLKLEAAKTEYEQSLLTIRHLFNRNLATVNDAQLRRLAARGANSNSTLYRLANDVDKFGVALLTTQPATTAANIGFSTGRIGIDAIDTIFKNVIRDTMKLEWSNPFRGSTDVLRYLVADREVADVTRLMFTGSQQANRLFMDASRAEADNMSSSLLARVGTNLNILNQMSDNAFKNAVFTASLSRSLRELNDPTIGKSIEEFITNGGLYSDLPDDIIKRAVDDSLRFTFQKGYEERDTLFSKAANRVIRTHQEVPFFVSSVLGVPFPRYIANHLEFFHDYMPGAAAITISRELITGQRVEGKDMATRLARQMSGLGVFSAIYGLRAMQGPETDIGFIVDEQGNTLDTNRVLGPLVPMYEFADILYRHNNGMPVGGLTPNLAAIEESLLGTGFAFEGSGFMTSFGSLSAAYEAGVAEEELAKRVADVASRFTYPAAAFRDIMGQLEARAAIKPYTKSTEGDTVNFLDVIEVTTEPAQRFGRFVADVPVAQWFESVDGRYDLPLYSPFNNRPVQEINPMMKQLTGIRTNVPMSAVQREFARLRIPEYTMYRTSRVPNPSLDYAVRVNLAREDLYNLPGKLEEFINSDLYQSLSDKQKEVALKAQVSGHITTVADGVKGWFNQLVHEKPNLAMGYLRNDLLVKGRQIRRKYGEDEVSARVQSVLKFPDADAYLEDAGTNVAERAKRMQEILFLYEDMDKTYTGIGQVQ